jgi:type III secretion protein T
VLDALTRLLDDPEVGRWLGIGVLLAARVLPLVLVAPFLATRAAPVALRTGVGLVLVAALAPMAEAAAPPLPGGGAIPLLAVREALLGATFAVAAAAPLHALDGAGRLIDGWRGASQGEVQAPGGERTSPLGALYLTVGVALFVSSGGLRLAIAAFADGLRVGPLGPAAPTAVASGTSGAALTVALGVARLVADALAFSFAVAAPAGVAVVVVDVGLGLLGRASPQIPTHFAGMPLRAAAGLGAALLGLSLVVDRLPAAFALAVTAASRLVSGG